LEPRLELWTWTYCLWTADCYCGDLLRPGRPVFHLLPILKTKVMRAITEKQKATKWGWVSWIVLPILVLGLVEALVRTTTDRMPLWYGAAERVAERDRVDVIFVGSSRVLAAVLTDAFSETVALQTGYRPRTLNLGRGYTTLIEHYLGLRNLLLTHP